MCLVVPSVLTHCCCTRALLCGSKLWGKGDHSIILWMNLSLFMSLHLRPGLSQLFLQWYSCTQPSFLLSSLAEVFPLHFLETLTPVGYFYLFRWTRNAGVDWSRRNFLPLAEIKVQAKSFSWRVGLCCEEVPGSISRWLLFPFVRTFFVVVLHLWEHCYVLEGKPWGLFSPHPTCWPIQSASSGFYIKMICFCSSCWAS